MPSAELVDVDFASRANVVATVELTVAATPEQVWQVLNDTDRWPEWFTGMKVARVTSAAWDGLGSTRFVRVGPLAIDEEIVAWEPNKLWAFAVTQFNTTGWIAKRMLEMVEISAEGSGSRLKYTGAIDPVPWLRPMGFLLKKQIGSAWATNLPNIDRQVAAVSVESP